MQILSIARLSAIATTTVIPFIGEMPVLALPKVIAAQTSASTQNLQPQVQFRLAAEKKTLRQNQQGKQQVTWQTLQGNLVIQSGDVIRYTLSGKNNSARLLKNLVVTQPIPKQTTYILNSITAKNKGTKITYSIDNGNSFVEKPTTQVKLPSGKVGPRSVPAELYTHIRWKFVESIAPATVMNATYQVKVR